MTDSTDGTPDAVPPPGESSPDADRSTRRYSSMPLDDYAVAHPERSAVRYAPGARWAGADPGERGDLIIDDRVVERISAQAALEVPDVYGLPRRRRDGEPVRTNPPKARARVTDDQAAVRLQVAVRWPAGVRTVTEALRARVRQRVSELTGLRVGTLDVTVSALIDPTATGSSAPRVR